MHGPVSPPQPRRHTEAQLEPRDPAQTHRQAVTARQTHPGQQDVLALTDVITEPDDADAADADEEARPEELAEAALGASERQRRLKVERRRPVFVSMLKKDLKYATETHKIIIIIKSYDKMHLFSLNSTLYLLSQKVLYSH